MNSFSRMFLLLWKNFKFKIRHPLVSLIELTVPCLFSVILAIVRVVVTFDDITNSTIYLPYPIINENALISKTILYAPKSPQIDQVMDIFLNITYADSLEVKGFENEDLLLDYYEQLDSNSISCGVVFNALKQNNIDFKLRFPFVPKKQTQSFSFKTIGEFTWKTGRNFPLFQEPGPRSSLANQGGPPDYYNEGFLYVQHQVAQAIAIYFNPASEKILDNIIVNVQRFPYPPYKNDKFLFSLQFMFPLILMLSFIYPSVNLTKNIVLEKEQRLKEAMKMMGLQDWLHWASWFINSFIWNLISVLIITALLCAPLANDLGIISKSDPILVLLFFVLYNISSIMFCFFLSTLFNRANIAGIAAGALYFASFLPYFQVNMNYHELSFSIKVSISLIFNTNMAIGCMLISMWESEHIGLQWSNVFEPASPDDNLTFFYVILMFLIDSVIYFFAAIYINNVFPGEFGVPKKWYFFVQPSYWFPTKNVNTDSKVNSSQEHSVTGNGICIDNLSKTYNGGQTYSIKSLCLNMQLNDITVLLGHNGAGKTTLMSILCGLIPPTSGQVFINGVNLAEDIDQIRQNLGICPQFDTLFDYLSVEEHLWFYCKLKNIDNRKIPSEIDHMIALLDLENKRHKKVCTLSGGMKRKLSVGIALVGGSKFVLLDEATSGMDVSARRFIWDLLIKEKSNRVILLSTHFMEEADVLGDKIAIIEKGSLKCFGSPMSLKKQFGLGYLLTFVVDEDCCNLKLLTDLIRSHINGARILTSVGSEVTFSLPDNETYKFELLFKTIEQNKEKLGVINYGISVTTIEEVFLRVGDFAKEATSQFNTFTLAENELSSSASNHQSIMAHIKHNSIEHNRGLDHLIQIFWSLFSKKLIFVRRNYFLVFSKLILPGLLLLVSILTNKSQMSKSIYSPPMALSVEKFKTVYLTSFHDNESLSVELSKIYLNTFSSTHYVTANNLLAVNKTRQKAIEHLVDYGSKQEMQYNMFYLLSAIFLEDNGNSIITALFNNQAYHTSAISVAYIDRTLLRYLLNSANLSLQIWNEPFPRKHSDTLNSREFDSALQVQLAHNVQFSICFLLASYVILLVKEKTTNFKHIQQISGLKLFQYWISNFILDYAFYVICSLTLVAVIYLMNVQAFSDLQQVSYLIMAFLFHGLSSLPLIYILSLFFRDASTAYVRVSLYLLITGTTTFLVVLILEVPDFGLVNTSKILDNIFTFVLPIYTMAMCVFSLYQNYSGQQLCMANITIFNKKINVQDLCKDSVQFIPQLKVCCKGQCGDMCFPFENNYLAWTNPGIGKYLVAFVCQAIVLWAILTLLEYDLNNLKIFDLFFAKTHQHQFIERFSEDSDVRSEEERIKRKSLFTLNKTDSMIVQNVSKYYGKFLAVNNISFGVKRGECFGILGVNGAGKTTTFKMITGLEKISKGNILINGYDVKKDLNHIFKDIGYCPQFDALLEQFTGREALKIVSRIRGIKEKSIDSQIDALGKLLYFDKHVDQTIDSYSGGTKRKLSFALSIVGNPLITFLDEPTTGVDPVSRRCLWNAIQLIRAAGSSVVLTSHSMEECEALCNRLMIMVNSRIMCIGSPIHLKHKFGAGYIIQVKLLATVGEAIKDATFHISRLNHYLTSNLKFCRLESIHNNLLTYRLETNDIMLSDLFGMIESAKSAMDIEDYSIYQTSLERIFLSFARKQRTKNDDSEEAEDNVV